MLDENFRRLASYSRICTVMAHATFKTLIISFVNAHLSMIILIYVYSAIISFLLLTTSVVWWSELLATDPEVRVRFPALPDFLRSSGSGMGSIQPREYN
jgi:hypothetical protein